MMNPKYTAVVDDIRQEILRGNWRPRHRIPTRDALINRYSASRATIQKAMDELLREGFLFSNGKLGTFVTDTPPNLNSIAVIFPSAGSNSPSWDSLWSGFVSQKRYFEAQFNRTFTFYYLELDNPDCSELDRLRADAKGGKLAGIIMPFAPPESLISELRRYHISMAAMDYHSGVNTVWVDFDSFFNIALDDLKTKGCRQVALLVNDRMPLEHVDNFIKLAEKYEITVPANLIQGCGIDHFAQSWISRLVRLMMQNGPGGRPDGLIVANENMVDAAINGIQQENLVVGRDVAMVCHCNFPVRTPNGYNLLRAGFNINTILEKFLNVLQKDKAVGREIYNELVPAEREDQLLTL